MLDDVLAEARVTYQDLDAIGVATGPGNFTGLRIAVSAARGLALSLGIPAVGVTLFDALALDAPTGSLLLTLDAPQDKHYIQTRNGSSISAIETKALDEIVGVSADTCVIGQASERIATQLGCTFAPAAFAPASALVRIAAERFPSTYDRPAPLYMRPPDAAPSADQPPVILS
jgi:tRNA threonylcarbamoyl adenosine modification protein YeaZ